MPENKSIYHQALSYLILNEEITVHQQQVAITLDYSGIKFSPPRKIGDVSIIYLYDQEKQSQELQRNGVFRRCIIEPVEVIKNFLSVTIHVSVSIDCNFR